MTLKKARGGDSSVWGEEGTVGVGPPRRGRGLPRELVSERPWPTRPQSRTSWTRWVALGF